MIKTKHILDYCYLCETDMVRCITCGNNCCSGGYGQVDGKTCHDCPDAYSIQDAYYKCHNAVAFEKTMNRWWFRLWCKVVCYAQGHKHHIMMCVRCGSRNQ